MSSASGEFVAAVRRFCERPPSSDVTVQIDELDYKDAVACLRVADGNDVQFRLAWSEDGVVLSCPRVESVNDACVAFTARTPPPSIQEAMEFIVDQGTKELGAGTGADGNDGALPTLDVFDGSGSECGVNSDGEYEYEDEDMLADDWHDGSAPSTGAANAGAGAPSAPLSAPPLTRGRSHVAMTMQDVQEWIVSLTRQVVAQHDLHPTDAKALLRLANWDTDKVSARLNEADCRDRFIAEAGATATRPTHRPPFPRREAEAGMLLCNVCFGPIEEEKDAHALECGHWHCKACWSEALAVAVTNRGVDALHTVCLEPDCGLIVDDETFHALLPAANRPLYDKLVFDSFVSSNPSVVYCPRPQCGQLVAHSIRKRTVTCKCGHMFCFSCGKNPHAPVPCSLRDVWKDKIKKDDESGGAKLSEEERQNYKFCPNPACRVITYRDGGCMYLVCRMCREPWCWKCGQWGSDVHHVYECNDAINQEWAGWSDSRLFSDEGRYDFYYQRYREHKKSLKYAAEQLERAEKQEASLVRERYSLGEINFVKDVVKLIIRCRRALAWTNVYAFFIKSPLERQRFQCTESQLEELTEQMSGITEVPVETMVERRAEIMGKTATLTKFLVAVEDYDADEDALASEEDLRNLATGRGVGADDHAPHKERPKKKRRT